MRTAPIPVRMLAAALGCMFLSPGAWAGPVDINTADARTLARELTGIGLARAQAIVEYRQKNGPFRSADELAKVKGIGKQVIEKNRVNIRIEKAKGGDPKPPAAKRGDADGG
jgi:competence protein ComEA